MTIRTIRTKFAGVGRKISAVMLAATFCVSIFSLAHATSLDSSSLLDAGYRDMYNLQFAEAHHAFARWEQQHPQDPLGPAADAAAYLFSEFNRLHVLEFQLFTDDRKLAGQAKLSPDPAVRQIFQVQLEKSRQLAEAALRQDPHDANALFAQALRFGLRADYAGLIEKRYLAALDDTKRGRVIADQLLAQHPQYYDAYLAIGMENYLLSLKPAPFRWLLRLDGAQTDKATGIADLRIVAHKGHYLLPYARLLLAVAALRDNDPGAARELLRGLAQEFPRNPLYTRELALLERTPQ